MRIRRLTAHLLLSSTALLASSFLAIAPAQASPDTPATPTTAQQEPLLDVLAALQRRRDELAAAEQERSTITDEERRAAANAKVTELESQVLELERRFDALASGVDGSAFVKTTPDDTTLAQELETVLLPLVQKLKAATKEPREIEHLKQEETRAIENRDLAKLAMDRLAQRMRETRSEPLQAELRSRIETWRSRYQENDQTARVARLEYDRRLENQRPFLEVAGEAADDFFQTRGLNLLLAAGAFVAALISLRMVGRALRRVTRRKRQSVYRRALEVLWNTITVLAAFLAMMAVLYFANDWLVLLLVLIFLGGLGWASIQLLPKMFEQVRVLLNLGGIREGERMLWEGVPYQIAHLGMYTQLENPDLSSGVLRIPIRDLIDKHSRPIAAGERWFPCRAGDWVLLADDTRARVEIQTPEFIQLRLPGGGPKTYATPDFLALAPKNLSGGFRIELVFGVDYSHQAICTTEIPKAMLARLRRDLPGVVPESATKSLTVEFMAAAASSLDYEIQADFDGSVAELYERIQFSLSRILVDACNEHGWVIPFQQLTVHRAITAAAE